MALRLLTGLTLGGVFPNMMALATEYCPERYRASLVSITYVGLPLGFIVAGWSTYMLLPHYGWRGAMVVGGILPIMAAVLVLSTVPESLTYFLSRAEKGPDCAKAILERMLPDIQFPAGSPLAIGVMRGRPATVADLFRDDLSIGTLVLWVALATNSVVYYFVLGWMPSILVKIGAEQDTAIMASSLTNLGGVVAAFVTGPLMDRYGTYRVLIAHFLVGTVFTAVVATVLSPNLAVIVPAALCLGFCVSGLQKGISALVMRFYPIDLRAIGLGWTFGIGRIGAVGGPFLAGLLFAAGWSPSSVFYLMAVPMLIGTFGVVIMAVRYVATTRGRATIAVIEEEP
jgi:AAHS family 4-hydroxybenzoate transporter-like MFS transporter